MPRPSNTEIATVFREIAELLAIRGGDRHRVRAFERVARIVENLPEPAERMVRYGTLQKVPGIGDGTLERVKEILRRGTAADLERLRAQLPPGLRELMRIQGLGAATVRLLYQRFQVATVEQLEAAARSGLLNTLPRFGVDRVHAILREIEAHKRRRGKLPLFEAQALAESLLGELRSVSGAVHAIAGGSVRRWKPMIGDLDLLVAAPDPQPVVERFRNLPQVEIELATKAEGGNVRLASGRHADLWVFPPECWGAGLHAFSGTKEHVVAIRARAGRRGLHISEHGVFTREGREHRTRLTSAPEEAEIFAAVGLPFIAPELRQNLGEIEAAENGRLPRLVEAEDLRGDLHLHTTDSDGSGTVLEMARAGADLGYAYLAITDHSQGLTVANGLDARRLRDQEGRVRRAEQELGRLALLTGVEVDIHPDGSLDLEPATLRRLDWVVASVHDHFELDADAMTARVLRALETGLVDVLGHPTGRKLGRREGYALDLDRVLEAARRLGVAVEINGDPRRMDLDATAVRRAREMGVAMTIDTDAHSPAHLRRREYGLAMARRGGLEARHVLNAQDVEAIREHRRARLRREGIVVTVPEAPKIVEETTVAKSPVEDIEGLVAALEERPLGEELRGRVERFLRQGGDGVLEEALARRGGNAVQGAFDLLMG